MATRGNMTRDTSPVIRNIVWVDNWTWFRRYIYWDLQLSESMQLLKATSVFPLPGQINEDEITWWQICSHHLYQHRHKRFCHMSTSTRHLSEAAEAERANPHGQGRHSTSPKQYPIQQDLLVLASAIMWPGESHQRILKYTYEQCYFRRMTSRRQWKIYYLEWQTMWLGTEQCREAITYSQVYIFKLSHKICSPLVIHPS